MIAFHWKHIKNTLGTRTSNAAASLAFFSEGGREEGDVQVIIGGSSIAYIRNTLEH
jgi:hypothetical protein